MECGDLSPLCFRGGLAPRLPLESKDTRLRQVAADQSGDRSPHSKELRKVSETLFDANNTRALGN
jgi:hypothetical protein